MQDNLNKERLQKIHQMLFEMAAGNFNFKIQRSAADDELESLVVLVNIIAEEMRNALLYSGYVNPHYSFQFLVQNTFVLDDAFIIRSFSPDVPKKLCLAESELEGLSFDHLLDDDSKNAWNLFKGPILWDPNFHITISLSFFTHTGFIIPAFCTVTRLLHSSKILISSVTIVADEGAAQNPVVLNTITKEPKKPLRHDAEVMQQVYDYILSHLDTPLPSIKQLSKLFGTNTFKLKEGFKHFFKISIYQFYTEERLKRAHLLIQKTKLPLSDIAELSGFQNYITFTKAFKKRFNYCPTHLTRGLE